MIQNLPIYLASITLLFFWFIIAKRVGWISQIKIYDKYNILTPVFLSLFSPFIIGWASNLIIHNIDAGLTISDLSPLAILLSASLTTLMAYKTIENNKRTVRIKNTISALDNDLYKGKSITKFNKACEKLSHKLESAHSFKALVRLRESAKDFVDEFMSESPDEYEAIIDILRHSDKLCYGVKAGIYDQEMVSEFLGDIIFDAWWSAMIIIRHEEFSYYDEIDKDYRRKPDFGSPYRYLSSWIIDVAEKQGLQQVNFVLTRLNTGIEYRDIFRNYDEYINQLALSAQEIIKQDISQG